MLTTDVHGPRERHRDPVGQDRRTDAVIIGAGQSGLAMSAELSARSIDHVILEREEVGASWRRRRWDSLRLLTPNAQSVLPGSPPVPDPDGFMTKDELADLLVATADAIGAPVIAGVTVDAVRPAAEGYRIESSQGTWHARAVVVASGPAERVARPACSDAVPSGITQIDSLDYRNPDQLADGDVLVIGGAASGAQIAQELASDGRRVTLAAGEHVRMVRTHRGKDIHHWMDVVGLFDEGLADVESIAKARRVSSPHLIGTPERADLDLATLAAGGVDVRGRLAGIGDGRATFSAGLTNHCRLADQKLRRLLATIDEWIRANDSDAAALPRTEVAPTEIRRAPLHLDLVGVSSIVWATGVRPDHRFLDLPAFDDRGRLRHDGGIVADAPGVYVLGLTFLRRRRSSFISGAAPDAADLAVHLAAHLDGRLPGQP